MSQDAGERVRQVTARCEREGKEAEAHAQRALEVRRQTQQEQVAQETEMWMH